MQKGLVSIITPCFNGERFLADTIESVLNQSYTNFEMIIIDDGSTDNTTEIAKEYSLLDSRVKYLHQPNAGSASARNNGIRNAEGQYIVLLDHDDLWNEDFLEKQIGFITKNNAVCVCSSYERINENSKQLGIITKAKPSITVKDMYVRNYVGCLTGVYDCSAYGKVYLNEELKSLRDDYAYWIDIAKTVGTIYGNQEVLAKYRIYEQSCTGDKKRLVIIQYQFYRNYLKLGRIKSIANVITWGCAGIISHRIFLRKGK